MLETYVYDRSCACRSLDGSITKVVATLPTLLELRAASIVQAPDTVPVRSFDKTIHLLHSPIFCLLETHFRISPATSMLPFV